MGAGEEGDGGAQELKSDQNGIEISYHLSVLWSISSLKSDQNGIEIHFQCLICMGMF